MRALVWLGTGIAVVLVWLSYSASSPFRTVPRGDERGEADRHRHEREYPEDLSEEALPRLMKWVQANRSRTEHLPSRDIFRKGPTWPVSSVPAVSLDEVPPTSEPTELEQPRLTGFVFSGGNVNRPVAAIRFDGRMWLVEVGEPLGPFRVEEMVVGEEVRLVNQESGESLRLVIR